MDPHRIAIFTGPGQIELRADPAREPGPGEVEVKLRACALCTMEQRLWRGPNGDYPIAPGHEAAGVVAAVHPEGVLGLSGGERVAIAFLDRCMQCDACRRGDSQLCTGKLQGREPGRFRRIGGLADSVIVPAWKVFPLPGERSFDEIALCEPLACVIHSVEKGNLSFGDDVLVVGGGTMGQLHLLVARLRGARVFVSDPDPERRRLALDLGANAVFEPGEAAEGVRATNGGSGADAVFVTFGHADTAAQASGAVRPGGRIVYYGSFPAGSDTGFDAQRIHVQGVVLDGARGQTLEDFYQASRLLARGLIDVRPLISGRYPLDRLMDALERASAPDSFRIVVNP